MLLVTEDTYRLTESYFDRESYIEWLESFTIDDRIPKEYQTTYHHLINKLWSINYIPSIGNDVDRATDGLELRSRYYDIYMRESGLTARNDVVDNVVSIFGECTLLEMLIALSMNMYDIMQDMDIYNSVSRWFWELLKNAKIDRLDDSSWDDLTDSQYVEDIVKDIMELKENGYTRGWFDLDIWTSVEIWYQMHKYLSRYFNDWL